VPSLPVTVERASGSEIVVFCPGVSPNSLLCTLVAELTGEDYLGLSTSPKVMAV